MKHLSKITVTTAIFTSFALWSLPAMAEDCHRGTLDEAYCDRNLDQVADLPTDPNDWVDPSTLIFTYTPVEDPAVYANVWQAFIDHLEAAIDRRLCFFLWNLMQHNWKL